MTKSLLPTNTLPVRKLSRSEMQTCKGGMLIEIILGTAGIIAACSVGVAGIITGIKKATKSSCWASRNRK